MDSLSGQLRFFGLQALMGPDYIVDYSYDEAEPEAEADYEDQEELTEEVVQEQVENIAAEAVEEEGEIRRKDTVKKINHPKPKYSYKKIKSDSKKPAIPEETVSVEKKKTFYNDLPPRVMPPPSRYGQPPRKLSTSSYLSYDNEAFVPKTKKTT